MNWNEINKSQIVFCSPFSCLLWVQVMLKYAFQNTFKWTIAEIYKRIIMWLTGTENRAGFQKILEHFFRHVRSLYLGLWMAGGRKILSEQDCSEPEMQESWVEIQRPGPGSWLLHSLNCEAMVDVAVPRKALQLGLPDLSNENTE